MADANSSFSYHICGNSAVVIVNLKGTLNSESVDTLKDLHQELFTKNGLRSVILNLAEVEQITVETIPSLALLQKIIRMKQIELRICSIKIPIKEKLEKAGILRNSEVTDDSKEAIYSLNILKAKAV